MFKIYLAAPFFNPRAKAAVMQLLDALETAGHEVWCPMRDGIECPKDADSETRMKVFDLNVERIIWCEVVVALLDYALPENFEIRLIEEHPLLRSQTSTPIAFPDVGTVFEIGYAYAIDKCIIGCTEMEKGFNLMLAEACYGVVHSVFEMTEILKLVEKGEIARTSSSAPLEEL